VTHNPDDHCTCEAYSVYVCEYRSIADIVIRDANPPDGDEAESAIVEAAVKRLIAFAVSQPCECPPEAGPPDFNAEPCKRCRALGRAHNRLLDV
jgi:hypothetical protein